jgi:hypothetical protein
MGCLIKHAKEENGPKICEYGAFFLLPSSQCPKSQLTQRITNSDCNHVVQLKKVIGLSCLVAIFKNNFKFK